MSETISVTYDIPSIYYTPEHLEKFNDALNLFYGKDTKIEIIQFGLSRMFQEEPVTRVEFRSRSCLLFETVKMSNSEYIFIHYFDAYQALNNLLNLEKHDVIKFVNTFIKNTK